MYTSVEHGLFFRRALTPSIWDMVSRISDAQAVFGLPLGVHAVINHS